jgi:hypothetical protein
MKRSTFTLLVAFWACLLAASCTTPHHQELVDAGSDSGEASTDAGHGHLLGALSPSGTGFDFRVDGGLQPVAAGPATPAPTATNTFLGYCDAGGGTTSACWQGITQDMIGAAFTPTLSFTSGGTSPVEISATDNITPQFTGSPLPNGTGVTVYTIADSQGGGPTSRLGSGTNFQGPSTSYHATAPTTLTFTANVTKDGVNKNATASIAIDERWFRGTDSHSGGTAITASSTNATLSGGSATATLTGALAANFVGVSFSTSPSNEYVYMAFPHTGSAHTFHDQNGFVFAASVVVTSFSFTTGTGVTGVAYDIYRSDNLLNTSYTVTVVSMLEPPWLDADPANDVDDGRGAMPKSEAA